VGEKPERGRSRRSCRSRECGGPGRGWSGQGRVGLGRAGRGGGGGTGDPAPPEPGEIALSWGTGGGGVLTGSKALWPPGPLVDRAGLSGIADAVPGFLLFPAAALRPLLGPAEMQFAPPIASLPTAPPPAPRNRGRSGLGPLIFFPHPFLTPPFRLLKNTPAGCLRRRTYLLSPPTPPPAHADTFTSDLITCDRTRVCRTSGL
jgi:hypothetical protein